MRKCSMCGLYLDDSNFKLKVNKFYSYCNNCSRLYNKEYMRIYRERMKNLLKNA